MASITKPEIHKDLAVYTTEELTEQYALAFVENMERHRPILRSLNMRGVVFSLKGCGKIELPALDKIAMRLDQLHRELRIITGFTDYPSRLFSPLEKLTKDTSLALFRTMQIGMLAVGSLHARTGDSILVFSEDAEENNLISSSLINRGFFVIKARSLEEAKARMGRQKFSYVVTQSTFGGLHDEITVRYDKNIFFYTVRGMIDEGIYQRFSLSDFETRLEKGFRLFVFELSRMTTMDAKAATFFLEVAKICIPAEARVCLVGMREERIFSNALRLLEQSEELWIYENMGEALADPDFLDLSQAREDHRTLTPAGLTKDMVDKINYLVSGTLSTLKALGKGAAGKRSISPARLKKMDRLSVEAATLVSFDGDLEGTLIFLFSEAIGDKVTKAMFGEALKGSEALDAMGEFVNSVAGRIKNTFSRNGTPISFSIPRSLPSTKTLVDLHGERKGVHMEMELDDEPFHIFITAGTAEELMG